MAVKTTRARRSKAEVQQEFAGIMENVSENKEMTSSKDLFARQMQDAQIQEAVSGIAVEAIIHNIANLNIEISKSLSHLAEKLTTEINLLNQVRAASAIEHQNLEQLHKMDIALTALDQLVEEYQTKKSDLELEISNQRRLWEEERENQRQSLIEEEAKLKTLRQREKEEYEYKKELERKKDQDVYEESCHRRDKENREKQETLEKNWQTREEALQVREKSLDEMQRTIDSFPARLIEEKEKVRLETAEQTEQKFSQQLLILQKDKETERLLAEMKISSLEETLSSQSTQIALLQKQLEEAKKEVKEIAEKAIDGASGARALSHINQIAIEQAKNRSSTN